MKRYLFALPLVALTLAPHCNRALVLYAQTVPAVKHAAWTPNAAGDNVISYSVTLDAGTAQTVLPASCTATLCTATITIPTFGAHAVTVVATNLALSTDPASLQNSPPATVAFTLNAAPKTASGATVTN